jgi:hypothetical protein
MRARLAKVQSLSINVQGDHRDSQLGWRIVDVTRQETKSLFGPNNPYMAKTNPLARKKCPLLKKGI